jgi:hypothetical protein
MLSEHFQLGTVVITANAEAALQNVEVFAALRRHCKCDWGNVCKEDWESNDQALRDGGRLLSAYTSKNGIKFWIITEADRSATTILLPKDY